MNLEIRRTWHEYSIHAPVCFSGDEIQILSAVGIICVCGKNLEITEINDEYISIKGCIDRIAYKD